MHAAPGRGLGKRAALALLPALALATAGCTDRSSDAGALATPSTTAPRAAAQAPGGPAVTFAGAAPQVDAHSGATTTLDQESARLPSGCTPALERSDPNLISVAWRCGREVAAATVTLAGHPVALGDLMTGAYRTYLSTVAQNQFSVEGQPGASTTDLATWYLTPAALAVVFPAGVVSYPLASLARYIKDPATL